MASLLDFVPADNQPPAAIVRRRGESDFQADARRQGYSDAQTGFDRSNVSRRGGGGGVNPLARAYQIASQREVAATRDENADANRALREREFSLREREQAIREQVQASAERDRMAQIDQTQGFLTELNDIETTSPRGTKDFYARALRTAAKYPHAISSDPRIGQMLNHYEESYLKTGGTEESAKALWELGQVDTSSPDAAAYLQTIPGKYPGAFQAKEVQDVYKDVQKRIPGRTELPGGLTPKGATMDEMGNVKVQYDQDNRAMEGIKSLEREAVIRSRSLDRAKRIRAKATDKDIIKDADDEIRESKEALDDIRGQITNLYKTPGVSPSVPAPATGTSQPVTAVSNFADANAVKAAFKAGKLDRAAAEAALKKFGFQ